MVGKRNGTVPNAHFRKDWQRYIKTWFNQPLRKQRRHNARVEKARSVAPRPTQKLRPLVHCPTIKYNTKIRLGRGFTIDELKSAGIARKFAPTIGIKVDYRRKNRSVESIQRNVARLKQYRSKLILFPLNSKKPRSEESSAEEISKAQQLTGTILPVIKNKRTKKARLPTAEEKKFNAFHSTQRALANKRLVGIREKKAKEAAESLDAPKKK